MSFNGFPFQGSSSVQSNLVSGMIPYAKSNNLVGDSRLYRKMQGVSPDNLTQWGTLYCPALNLGTTTITIFEEGSWTPTIITSAAPGATTYTVNKGWFQRIGNLVTVMCYIQINTPSTSNNALRLSGLPYTVATGASYFGALACCYMYGMGTSAQTNWAPMGHCTQGTNYADLYDESNKATSTAVTLTGGVYYEIMAGTILCFFGSYPTS